MENIVNSNTPKDKLAGAVKGAGLVVGIYRLAKIFILSAFFILVLIALTPYGMPWYIVGLAAIGALLLISLQVIALVRLGQVDTAATSPSQVEVNLSPDEKLAGYVAGVMRVGAGAGGYAVLGTGKIKNSENALLVTDRNVLAVTVPLAGAGKIMAGTNITTWQWLMSSKKIKDWLETALTDRPLAESVRGLSVNQVWSWAEIEKVESDESSQSIFLVRPDGQKTRYAVRDKDEFTKAKQLLKKEI